MTPQRSSVRAMMSALIAAIEIGRPRIEPELSISSVTTVSLNSLLALDLVAQRMAGADDHAGEPRGVEQAFLLVEVPASGSAAPSAAAAAGWRAG